GGAGDGERQQHQARAHEEPGVPPAPRRRARAHRWAVTVTGMENVAPWHALTAAVLIEAAPARCTRVVLFPDALAVRPVWSVNVTLAALQPLWPESTVI